jgi:hypothetical protein
MNGRRQAFDRNIRVSSRNEENGGFRLGSSDSSDRWFERLLKYFPAESLSLFLVLDGIFKSISETSGQKWVFGVLIVVASVVFNCLFLRKFWMIVSYWQIAYSSFALLVYMYAVGGVFALLPFYEGWHGTTAVVLTSALLSFAEPPKQSPGASAGN